MNKKNLTDAHEAFLVAVAAAIIYSLTVATVYFIVFV